MDERGPQATPMWMDVPSARVHTRKGVTAKNTFWQTVLFFGAITLAVGAAGVAGVAVWGPDKQVKNRSQLATNPPAPTALPTFAASASASASAGVPPIAAPADSAAADAKKAAVPKKGVHVGKRRH